VVVARTAYSSTRYLYRNRAQLIRNNLPEQPHVPFAQPFLHSVTPSEFVTRSPSSNPNKLTAYRPIFILCMHPTKPDFTPMFSNILAATENLKTKPGLLLLLTHRSGRGEHRTVLYSLFVRDRYVTDVGVVVQVQRP